MLLGRAHARADMLTLLNLQLATATDDLSPAHASATKVYGSEMATQAYRTLMEVVGPEALVRGARRVRCSGDGSSATTAPRW